MAGFKEMKMKLKKHPSMFVDTYLGEFDKMMRKR